MLEQLDAEMEFELGKVNFAQGNFPEASRRLKKANVFQKSLKVKAIILLISIAPRLMQQVYFRFLGRKTDFKETQGELVV